MPTMAASIKSKMAMWCPISVKNWNRQGYSAPHPMSSVGGGVSKLLKSVIAASATARPTVTFPVAGHHCP